MLKTERAQQILRLNSVVNDNLNSSISPEWTQIIRDKLPQKAKNMEENIQRLLITRQRRSGMSQTLNENLESFKYF